MANGDPVRTKEIILTTLMVLVTAVFGWMMRETIDTFGFKRAGDRFTDSDGAKLKAELRAEFQQTFPPKWIINDIQHLREEIAETKMEDRRLQVQIQALDCRELGDHYVPPQSSVDPELFENAGG